MVASRLRAPFKTSPRPLISSPRVDVSGQDFPPQAEAGAAVKTRLYNHYPVQAGHPQAGPLCGTGVAGISTQAGGGGPCGWTISGGPYQAGSISGATAEDHSWGPSRGGQSRGPQSRGP